MIMPVIRCSLYSGYIVSEFWCLDERLINLEALLLHTAIDCRTLGIPSALPYISYRSAD